VESGLRRVAFGYGAFVALFGALAAYRWHIWSYGADTGTFTQVTLHAFSGFGDTPEGGTHFSTHWAPLLAALYPLIALTHSGLALQLVQIALIGASVFPFYGLLRRYAAPGPASWIALLPLVYPPLVAVAFGEFHEIAFYPPLVFGLLWALDRGAWAWAAGCGALLLLVREEVLIVMAVFGAALAVAALRPQRTPPGGLLRCQPRAPRAAFAAGVLLCAASLGTLGFYFEVLLPRLGGWRATHFYEYPFAHGPLALVAAAAFHPLAVLGALATLGRLTYLLEAFVPLLFLPLRSAWTAIAVPGLLVDLMSSDPIAWRMGDHYAATWAPWLLVATAAVLVRGDALALGRRRALGAVFATCGAFFVAFDPLHPIHYLQDPYPDQADARLAFGAVPRDASVVTHDEWFAHFAGSYPRANHVWMDPSYAVYADDFRSGNFQHRILPMLRREVAAGAYRPIARYGRVVVYRRVRAAGP
jgi:uncharacterized membrane protein